MEYKDHTVVVAVIGVLRSDRWQAAFSIHKPTGQGIECVHRVDDPTPYATRDEAADAAYRAARDWIDAQCKVN
jgi:hypothetical protein